MRTLREAARLNPCLVALCSVDALQTSLERNTRNVPRDGRFHVRVRDRIVFSGCFADARARYDRALATRLRRRAASLQPAPRPCLTRAPAGLLSPLPAAVAFDARRRRLSWRVLVPPLPPEPRGYPLPPDFRFKP